MNIVYDHEIFTRQAYGGISRYFCELVRRIDGMHGDSAKILAPLSINRLLVTLPSDKVLGFRIPAVPKVGKIVRSANRVATNLHLRIKPPDILHQTYYRDGVTASFGRTRCVITVHDMIHEKFREQFPPGDKTIKRKRKAVERADHVICVSENTRKDLLEFIDVDPGRVSVVHHGAEMTNHAPAELSSPVEGPYILYVGERARYKNFSVLFEAYAGRPYIHENWSLVCFGGKPFSPAERRRIGSLGQTATGCRQLFGDDAMLAGLYTHAQATVIPSLYEGFGIPALEAMWHGCPLVCSTGGALPEVVGDAAEFFDPNQPDDIASALERVLSSQERADALRYLGRVRSKSFSWDRCARDTRAIYSSLL